MSKCILVVEDQEDNRKIMHDLLASAGYDVIEANNGNEGVAMAASHKPDVILMDIRLPGIDGYEAVRQIKSQPKLAHIPIFSVTSYALSGEDARAREAGCDEYFQKPFSPRELLAKVREYAPQ